MAEENAMLLARVERLEKRLMRSRIALMAAGSIAILSACATVAQGANAASQTADVLRLRGLIIEDDAGRPRIIMGAPAPRVPGRNRSDELVGLAYIDSNGADRITIGDKPEPMTAEGIKPRRVGGAGMLIHDQDGVERGGYAVLDDGMALLTVDWPKTGEGAVISAGEKFAGVGVFHRSDLGVYREAVTMGAIRENEQAFIKIAGANGNQRLRLELDAGEDPELLVYDAEGRQVRKSKVD